MGNRKVILYIASSLDGYIADQHDSLDFLSVVERPPEDYGYAAFTKSIDTVVMGRKTYDKVLSFGIDFPHRDKKCFVISKKKSGSDENAAFWNNDPCELIRLLLKQTGKDIFIDGGSGLVNTLMKQDLIDRYIISIIPVLIGNGIPLFKDGRPTVKLKLLQSKSYPTGLVQNWYEREIS
ncbi:MAG TPA: dihydrofolate reductase family protein [Bacteroidia bacterium]|nr:dihydrofolate reductase family protein [Bacteroidia bacterium]